MIVNKLIATKLGLRFSVTGRAVSWFARPSSTPSDVAASVYSISKIPVTESVRPRNFVLDESRLLTHEEDTYGVHELKIATVESNYDWSLTVGTAARTQRYGSIGYEALTTVTAGTTFGVMNLQTSFTPTQLIDILIEEEVNRFPRAKDALRKRFEKSLKVVRQYAALEKRNCVAYVPIREIDGVFDVYSPFTSSGLLTSTGRTMLPEGVFKTSASGAFSDIYDAFINILDEGEVSADVNSGEVEASINSLPVEIQVASLNDVMRTIDQNELPKLGGLLMDTDDLAFWYTLVKSCVYADRTIGDQLKAFGFNSIRDAIIYASQGSRFVAVPV